MPDRYLYMRQQNQVDLSPIQASFGPERADIFVLTRAGKEQIDNPRRHLRRIVSDLANTEAADSPLESASAEGRRSGGLFLIRFAGSRSVTTLICQSYRRAVLR
jgi:hypothetical protein